MRLWRVSEFVELSGTDGLVAPGRWHRKGRPIVYMAESSALAMLEVLVNLEAAQIPPPFQLLQIDAPDDLNVTAWPAGHDASGIGATSAWGDAFLRANGTLLARVPSVVAPESWNYLLNPLHPGAEHVTVTAAGRWPWDARLFDRA